jgi:hypothetical protein
VADVEKSNTTWADKKEVYFDWILIYLVNMIL